jgi:hypothetical protein
MAIDYEATLEARNKGLVALAKGAAREQYAASINQPGGLIAAVWEWDSGDDTTALTAAATKRTGVILVRWPCTLKEWHIAGYPSGSAVVNILKANEGVALSAATTIVSGAKPTLSSQEEASNTTLAEVSIPAKCRLYALLESVSTIRNLTVTLTMGRVPA